MYQPSTRREIPPITTVYVRAGSSVVNSAPTLVRLALHSARSAIGRPSANPYAARSCAATRMRRVFTSADARSQPLFAAQEPSASQVRIEANASDSSVGGRNYSAEIQTDQNVAQSAV